MYNFRVDEKAIKVTGTDTIIKGKKCLVHENGTPLSVVSDRYRVITHSDLVLPFEEALASIPQFRDYDVTTHLPYDGSQMYRRYTFRNINLEPKVGDIIRLQLEVTNSLDGKIKGGFRVKGDRLSCTNGQMFSEAMFSLFAKHYSNFDISKIVDKVKQALPLFEEAVAKWKTWHDVKWHVSDIVARLEKMEIPTRTQEKIVEQFKKEDQTKYGAFQAMTWVITHETKARKEGNDIIPQLALEKKLLPIFY